MISVQTICNILKIEFIIIGRKISCYCFSFNPFILIRKNILFYAICICSCEIKK